VSVDERIAAMTRIMREEELYRDPALTLEELAQRLGVNPHQLSELLNSLMGTTFRAYLNGLRIERAKSFLLEDGASTILDIAFESGFNSKSAFNAAFRNETGQTPSEYRKCR
jgi:AraC-like DNA-binding protein